VMKTRDTRHDGRLWEIEITDGGVRLTRPFPSGDRELMAGGRGAPSPRASSDPTEEG